MDRLLLLPTGTLAVDFSNSFMLITWHGNVNFQDYKRILKKAIEIAETHNIHRVIINRLKLTSFSNECGIWMKNYFLKKMAKPLIPLISKLATIDLPISIGQMYGKTIAKTVSSLYPNLDLKSFQSEVDAYQWITPGIQDLSLTETPVSNHESPLHSETIDSLRITTTGIVNMNDENTVLDSSLDHKRDGLLDSVYQLFFGNR